MYDKINPLHLTNKKGEEIEFKNIKEFYIQTLFFLYKQFPNGKVDYLRFLADHTAMDGWSLNDNGYVFSNEWLGTRYDDDATLCYQMLDVNWQSEMETRFILGHLILGLCYYNNSYYKPYYNVEDFDEAFDVFWFAKEKYEHH